MTEADRISLALDELREQRDELRETLLADLNGAANVVGDIAFELDNALAEVNHGAVMEGVEGAVAAIMSVGEEEVRELARLSAIHFPGDGDELSVAPPLDPPPAAPSMTDPKTVVRDVDASDDEWRDEIQYVLRWNAEQQADHVRALLRYAWWEFLQAVAGAGRAGDEEGALRALAGRTSLCDRLSTAAKGWEVAEAASMFPYHCM